MNCPRCGPLQRNVRPTAILIRPLVSLLSGWAAVILEDEGFAPGMRQLPFTMIEAHAYEGRSANSCHLGAQSLAQIWMAHIMQYN